MQIIIGLGNPGKKYELTRHNAGFMALDRLAERAGLNWEDNKKMESLIARQDGVIYAKPQTFMNNSGRATAKLLSYYKLISKKFGLFKQPGRDLSDILTIIHDDIDIGLGDVKFSQNRSSAGHKGVQSVMDYLKTKQFNRIRIGIAGKGQKTETDKYVLNRFGTEELPIIKEIIEKVTDDILRQTRT